MTLRRPTFDLAGFHKAFPSLEQTVKEVESEWARMLGPFAALKRMLRCVWQGHKFSAPLVLPPAAPGALGFVFVTCMKCGHVRTIPVKVEMQMFSGVVPGREMLS